MKMKVFLLFVMAFGSMERETGDTAYREFAKINAEKPIVVKIEESEYVKVKKFGVFYDKNYSIWRAHRWSKNENKIVYNGGFDNEETAALASDTLARKLMKNGEHGHKLNFPGDETEVYRKTASSEYIGVSNNRSNSKWRAHRKSKNEHKLVYNGYFVNEKEAAHASDTLARKLMQNGEQGHTLNFPADETEVYPKEMKGISKYIGVTYDKSNCYWRAQRRSKAESKKMLYNGSFDSEKAAAHASDTLARKLMQNGEQSHKLNFPDNDTEVQQDKHKKKRKRLEDLENLQDN